MNSLVRKFRRLMLLAEAFVLSIAAAAAVAFVPFKRIAAWSSRQPLPERVPADPLPAVRRVRWAVRLWAKVVPWRSMCFEQALSAQWMLRRRGVATTLVYGVAKDPEKGFIAHTWVKAGERPVVGCENASDFTELARFPAA